jgi:hypothetical protein
MLRPADEQPQIRVRSTDTPSKDAAMLAGDERLGTAFIIL